MSRASQSNRHEIEDEDSLAVAISCTAVATVSSKKSALPRPGGTLHISILGRRSNKKTREKGRYFRYRNPFIPVLRVVLIA